MYHCRQTAILPSILVTLFFMLLVSSALMASTPHKISYQGRLTESDGSPVADGSYAVTFTIYDDPTVGTSKWTSARPVDLLNGLFAVILGDIVLIPDSVFNGEPRYLGISVDGGPEGAPRVPLVAVPYSFHALTADTARLAMNADSALFSNHAITADTAAYALAAAGGSGAWVDGGTAVRLTTGTDSVGIGTTTPQAKLDIVGSLSASGATNFGTDNLVQGVGALVAGTSDTANGEGASVTGGQANSAIGVGTHVGGGFTNKASGPVANIGGGADNIASDTGATVAGGTFNMALGAYSTVGGGGGESAEYGNTAESRGSVVSGGAQNTALGAYASIGGGRLNNTQADNATIAGGTENKATGVYGTVSGGINNEASGGWATVSGGSVNHASGNYAVISGGGGPNPGDSNSASGDWSVVGGGFDNSASGHQAVIAGGIHNRADAEYVTIGGGNSNQTTNRGAAIGGGEDNHATGFMSSIAGGQGCNATGDYSVVGGGHINWAQGNYSVVCGGGGTGGGPWSNRYNSAAGIFSFIGGGSSNTVDSAYAAIVGGYGNYAGGDNSFVGGGVFDSAFGVESSILGGNGNIASGWGSSVLGGMFNTASGQVSAAAGLRAQAVHDWSYVWSDNGEGNFSSAQTKEFAIRAGNGFRILADNTHYGAMYTNLGNGDGLRVYGNVSQGTSWGAIYATNTGSSPTLSVWPGTGLAAYFGGDINVAGSVLKSGGGFKIDNPVDPANRYLYHSSVESPDMMNIYNGNVVMDANGEATVIMPDYFEALNRDYRYQLTCIGGYAPVYIANEISNNSFRIAGGSPGLKVSWTVTGVRQDAWANAHRIPVEVDKSLSERGKYLHPEEHGMPSSVSVVSREK